MGESATWGESKGTVDLGDSQGVFRRLGDLDAAGISTAASTWYRPQHTLADFTNRTTEAPWEGIGTGWFYSVLGGGSKLRPYGTMSGAKQSKAQLGNYQNYIKGKRTDLSYDNTFVMPSDVRIGSRLRQDYAVATLFNGNFDATSLNAGSRQTVPGWSLFNGSGDDVFQDRLVNINTVTTLNEHLNKLGVNRSQPNYAVQMNGGDSITHNKFVMPDWGTLRFDLHVPSPDPYNASQGNNLRIFLNDVELQSSAFQRLVDGNSGKQFPAADLRRYEGNGAGARTGEEQSNRIGYAENGFQTFQVDIPNEFRGKTVELRFELSGSKTVYLDNVFFKSQHLLFGSPILEGKEARKNLDTPV
jgi:hypothetical protein